MSAPWTSATHGDPMVLALAGRLDSASVLGAARKPASIMTGTPHLARWWSIWPNPAVAGTFGDGRAAAVLDTYPDRPAALAAGADRDVFVGWAEELWNS